MAFKVNLALTGGTDFTAAAVAGFFASATGALPETTAFFTAFAAALAVAFAGAAALAAGFEAAVLEIAVLETDTVDLDADLAPTALPAVPPRAAEFLADAPARGETAAFAAVFVVAVFALATALALLVFAAVFAVFAAAFVGALTVAATALAGALAAGADLPLLGDPLLSDLAAVLPVAVLPAAAFVDLPDWAEAEAVARDRADWDAFFVADPLERGDADVTPAPFFFSFFVADGIRGTLLLRPAVETGRNCRSPTVPRKTARPASLSI